MSALSEVKRTRALLQRKPHYRDNSVPPQRRSASWLPPEPIVNARQDLLRYQQPGAYPEWQFPDDAYPPLSFERPEPANSVPEHETVLSPIAGLLLPTASVSTGCCVAW